MTTASGEPKKRGASPLPWLLVIAIVGAVSFACRQPTVRFPHAAHLGYAAAKMWSARIGGSVSQSPDSALDAQALAQLTVEWDRGAP